MTDWTNPKTNWTNKDIFNIKGTDKEGEGLERDDYGRIYGNMVVLKRLVNRFHGRVEFSEMEKEIGYGGIPTADFFNTIEQNLLKIDHAGQSDPDMPGVKQWYPNKQIWGPDDLNRIESTMLLLYKNLITLRKRKLKIMLGGGNLYYGEV